MKKVLYGLLVAALLAGILLPACAPTEVAPPEEEVPAKAPLRVACVSLFPSTDNSYGQGMMDAVKQFKSEHPEMVGELAITEMVDYGAMESAISAYANQGFDLVFTQGNEFNEATSHIHKDFPNTYFVCLDGTESAPPNWSGYHVKNHETTYLAGALAALITETDKLGSIVAVSGNPDIVRYTEAFKVGARKVNPDVMIYEAYIEDFFNAEKTKEIALAMADEGADIISDNCLAGVNQMGLIAAVKEREILMIGNVMDLNFLAPDNILTSGIEDRYVAILDAVTQVYNGTFTPASYDLGLKEGIVSLAPYHGLAHLVSPEVQGVIDDLAQQIIDGTIEVPYIGVPSGPWLD